MTSLSPVTFRSAVTSSVLNGNNGAGNSAGGTITDAASLEDAIASQALGGASRTPGDLTYSPLASADSQPSDFQASITSAILGGSDAIDAVSNLAALGATLNAMAQTAQSALSTVSVSDRATDLANYQSLYDSLDQAQASVNGQASNAASLGVSAPGDWANTDTAVGTAAIISDMSQVVQAHTALQQTIQSVGATLITSLLV